MAVLVIILIITGIIAYFNSLDNKTKAYYKANVKSVHTYQEVIFGEKHEPYKHCIICKTLYGCCPLDNKYKYPNANYTVHDCPATMKDKYEYLR